MAIEYKWCWVFLDVMREKAHKLAIMEAAV